MTSKERHQRRFDDKFRRDQVKLIEAGELTISDVSRLYNVRWNSVKMSYGYSDLKSFRAELKAVEWFYNYQRKQEKLGWRTPVAYEQYLDSIPQNQRPALYLHRFDN